MYVIIRMLFKPCVTSCPQWQLAVFCVLPRPLQCLTFIFVGPHTSVAGVCISSTRYRRQIKALYKGQGYQYANQRRLRTHRPTHQTHSTCLPTASSQGFWFFYQQGLFAKHAVWVMSPLEKSNSPMISTSMVSICAIRVCTKGPQP